MRNRAILLLALFCAVPALADYEGTLIVTLPPGAPMTELRGAVHFKKGRMRMDYTEPMQMSVLHDMSGKTTQLFPKTLTYSEMDVSKAGGSTSAAQQFPICSDFSDAEKCFAQMGFTRDGTERVNGYDCDVYRRDVEKDGKSMHVKMWRPSKIKYMVFVRQTLEQAAVGKAPSGGKGFAMQINIPDLKEKAQPDSLFAIPADYKKSQGFGMSGQRPTPEQMEAMKKQMQEAQNKKGTTP